MTDHTADRIESAARRIVGESFDKMGHYERQQWLETARLAVGDYASRVARLESALEACLEYLDGMVDVVDGSYGEPAPNREMSLVQEINEALGRGGF